MNRAQREQKLALNGHRVLYAVLRGQSFEIKTKAGEKTLTPGSNRETDFVSIIPLLRTDTSIERIVMVLVPRLELGKWSIELVGGQVNGGETQEQAARREAMEKAGLKIGRLEPIANVPGDQIVLGTRDHVFVGEDVAVRQRTSTEQDGRRTSVVFSAQITHLNYYLDHNKIEDHITATALSVYLKATGFRGVAPTDIVLGRGGYKAIKKKHLELRL